MYYKTSEEDYENVMGVPKNFEVGPPIQRRKKTGLKTLRIRHFKGQKLSIRIMENCLNSKIITINPHAVPPKTLSGGLAY